jgi:hypothetical protein
MSRILNNLLVVGTGSGQAMGITGGYASFNDSLLLGYDASGYSIYQYATASKNFLGGKLFLGLTADDGLTMLQSSIITFGTTSQVAALNIVSSAESTYIQGSGTTSYTWTPSNNGKISWTNRFYNRNELASIAVVGDKPSYTAFGTTSLYSYNTGNIVFSIGSSASVATEKMRIMNDSIAIPASTSLKIGSAAAWSANGSSYPLMVLYQPSYASNAAIYVSTSISTSAPVTNSAITVEGSQLSALYNGLSISGAATGATRNVPTQWTGSIQPGRSNGQGANIYINGGQNGIVNRRTGYIAGSITFNPNSSAQSNTSSEDYAYISQNYLTQTNYSSNIITSYNSYLSTFVTLITFATNSVTTNNISIADYRVSGGTSPSLISGDQGQYNTTITRYGLLIDFISTSGTVSTVLNANRTGIGTYSLVGWGVYQSDRNTKNFFAGQILLGTNSTDGSLLRVSGSVSISGNLSLTSTISDKIGATGPSGYILSASGSGVYWIPNTGSGGANSFVQNGNSFGATATLGTSDNYALQFEANNNVAMIIATNGNIGIGIQPSTSSTTGYKLSVQAFTYSSGGSIYSAAGLSATAGFGSGAGALVLALNNNDGTNAHSAAFYTGDSVRPLLYSTSGYGFKLFGGGQNRYFIFDNTGIFRIGDIGGSSPVITRSETLQVNGTGYFSGTVSIAAPQITSTFSQLVINNSSGIIQSIPASLYTITYASSFQFNGNNGTLQQVTLTDNGTVSLTSMTIGINYNLLVTQPASGNKTLNWGTTVRVAYGGSGSVPISTAGNAIDKYTILYDGSRYFVDYSLSYS